ncbi:breast cancer metastasis-suppressor 1-like protein [Anopheles ziemanni]|uniref:breast cancer metastasis-suppressor 1-like protein n=1 Tax=Anopheles coustani TaxID=139045 RepID=UPI00265A104D|nr:breast cancer metastasis-suppressor 1-like protein [Anopheles coustani]XP_058169639.1 breast cancer metastasis-suppressor 1-like protein [Anopheles ziemanni]
MDHLDNDSEATLTGDEGEHCGATSSKKNCNDFSLTEEVYKERKRDLMRQLKLLKQGKHPKYLARERALKKELEQRLLENELERKRLLELSEREYQREIREAEEEFERERIALLNKLEAEALKERELCYQEFIRGNLSVMSTPTRSCIVTRSKENKSEPKKESTPRLVYLLEPDQIKQDLMEISGSESSPKRNTDEQVVMVNGNETTMTFNGHLFHCGDSITIMGLQMNPISGAISRLSQESLYFKYDNLDSEQCFPLSDFRHGGIKIVPREDW